MGLSIEEFSKELYQEILTDAEADGRYAEDVFFDRVTSALIDAGEIDTADRADYRGGRGSGIRVDGYSGDPLESANTLTLQILDFHQDGDVGRLTATEMDAIFRRLQKFIQRSLDPAWRNALEETTPAFGLADLISSRWESILKIRLLLLSNRQLSTRIDGRAAEELDGRPVTYSVWEIGRLHRLATSGQAREAIEIDLESEFGMTLPLLPAHLSTDEYESYLAVVPGNVLASVYDRWGARLLEQNVRVFLQARGNVNKGIRKTLETDPQMFFAYNNGITVTAERVDTAANGGGLRLRRLHNLQIVNGGQTTASIHAAWMRKLEMDNVFVQMKLSVVASDRLEEVVPKISEYANSQNRVNAADFFANHPYHVRLEEFSRRLYAPSPDGAFRETRWFYERARGQYASLRAPLSKADRRKFDLVHPSRQRFTKTDLAKFLNVWDEKPHIVSLGAQKNFADFAKRIGKAWERQPNDFNEAYFREIVAKAIMFRTTEKLVSNQPWYEGGYRANIVAYAISKLALDISKRDKSVDFQTIWRRQSTTEAMDAAIADIAKSVCDILVAPPEGIRNVTEWAKKQACWDRVSQLDIQIPENFFEELLGKDEKATEVKDAVKDQKMLNGIEAQTLVVNAGAAYWQRLRSWAAERDLLSEMEDGVLNTASAIPGKIPSEKQATRIVQLHERLKNEGFVS